MSTDSQIKPFLHISNTNDTVHIIKCRKLKDFTEEIKIPAENESFLREVCFALLNQRLHLTGSTIIVTRNPKKPFKVRRKTQ